MSRSRFTGAHELGISRMSQEACNHRRILCLAERISSDLLTSPSSQDANRRHLLSIGRNQLGIPLPCPQICDRTEPVVAEATSAQVRWPGRCRPDPRECGNRGAGPDIDLAAALLRERM